MELTKVEERILRRAVYSDLKERINIYYVSCFLICVFCLLYLLDLYHGILGGIAVRVHEIFPGISGFPGIFLILYILNWYNEKTNALALIKKIHSNLSPDKRLHADLNPDHSREQK